MSGAMSINVTSAEMSKMVAPEEVANKSLEQVVIESTFLRAGLWPYHARAFGARTVEKLDAMKAELDKASAFLEDNTSKKMVDFEKCSKDQQERVVKSVADYYTELYSILSYIAVRREELTTPKGDRT
jgi:hypothetical protein